MLNTVFLDLDDTLNLFTPYAMKFAGCPIDPNNYKGEPGNRGSYDLLRRVNHYRPGQEFGLQEFWNMIPREFWAGTPKSPHFDAIIEGCERLVGPENVIILTAPTKDPDCLAGKLEWIHDNLPMHYHRQYIITPRKYYCSGPGHLMVDDSDDNLRAWRDRGGEVIRVPQPWNSDWQAFEEGRDWEKMQHRFNFLLSRACNYRGTVYS